jgi:Cytochrome c7 and related cytochrome c
MNTWILALTRHLNGAWRTLAFATLMALVPVASAQTAAKDFDHLRTGFALTGTHTSARCESCHIGGVFKGTPRDCESCHLAGARFARANVVKNTNHIPTQAACESCHSTRTFSGARMNHAAVVRGSCTTCHNGTLAAGKSADHFSTTGSCDSCHGTTAWRPASGYDHAGVIPGTCVSCHNGARARGQGGNHTPFQLVASIASTACDSCHKAGFTAWTPARLHGSVSVTTQCSTCHIGLRPSNATHSGQTVCETCHKSTSNWSSAKVDHGAFNAATNCASCHNGTGGAIGKSATHIPVGTTNCFPCHSPSASGWKPSSFNHTQVAVTARCATCHTGGFAPADGKSASHTPYQLVSATASANCDTCHKAGYVAWTPAKLHTSVKLASQCSACHLSVRPSNATHSGQTLCESCHKSTTTWSSAKVDHGTFNAATNCAGCHNGTGGVTGKHATHVPVGTASCFACHAPTLPDWKPSSFNHTQVAVTARCATCHTGGFAPADGKSASHTPYQLVSAAAGANCDTCHKAGYVAWTPAKLHTNVNLAAQCSACHLSARPSNATHSGQTQCESCHKSTTTWSSAKVDHGTYNAATNCASCHNGTGGVTGKPATHIPVGATSCFACHAPTLPDWKPSRFNHTQVAVTAQCASCHTGTFAPADGKPTSHIPYQLVSSSAAANCDTCHKAGYAAWTPAKFHANVTVTSQCSTCHLSVRPANATHAGQTQCETCHKSTSIWGGAKVDHATFNAATNCASCHNGSAAQGKHATHIPVGATSCFACHSPTVPDWRPTKFNHTQVPVTAQCATCHSGAFSPADGKPANHIPYQLVATAASANCDTCHKGSLTTWANGKLHASVTVNGQCKTCHAGAYTSQGADAKPANHIPEAQLLNGAAMECNACHTSTTSWSSRMNHNGSLGGGAGWCKSCHASGTSYAGGMERKSLTHERRTPAALDCSESGCHRPLGNKGAAYSKWD